MFGAECQPVSLRIEPTPLQPKRGRTTYPATTCPVVPDRSGWRQHIHPGEGSGPGRDWCFRTRGSISSAAKASSFRRRNDSVRTSPAPLAATAKRRRIEFNPRAVVLRPVEATLLWGVRARHRRPVFAFSANSSTSHAPGPPTKSAICSRTACKSELADPINPWRRYSSISGRIVTQSVAQVGLVVGNEIRVTRERWNISSDACSTNTSVSLSKMTCAAGSVTDLRVGHERNECKAATHSEVQAGDASISRIHRAEDVQV